MGNLLEWELLELLWMLSPQGYLSVCDGDAYQIFQTVIKIELFIKTLNKPLQELRWTDIFSMPVHIIILAILNEFWRWKPTLHEFWLGGGQEQRTFINSCTYIVHWTLRSWRYWSDSGVWVVLLRTQQISIAKTSRLPFFCTDINLSESFKFHEPHQNKANPFSGVAILQLDMPVTPWPKSIPIST